MQFIRHGRSSTGVRSDDGGARGVGVAGLAAVAVSYGLARQGYGLFVPTFRHEFGLSTQAVGLLASLGYAAYLAGVLVTGVLTPRVGPRLPVVVGCATAAAGMLTVAVAANRFELVAGVILAGASAGWTWAPFSDAVPRLVPTAGQDRALSLVSTGTAFGLCIAGAIALLPTATWRLAWAGFAALAVVAAVHNARLLPPGPALSRARSPRLRWRWFLCRRSVPLLTVTFGLSLTSSTYWTYGPDLIQSRGLTHASGAALWVSIGVLGGFGVYAAAVIAHFGLGPALRGCLIGVAAAMALLAGQPQSWAATLSSGALFGASYMICYAGIALWSQRVFRTRPAAGFTATILSSAAGFIAGPVAFGVLAGRAGSATALATAGGLTLLIATIGSFPALPTTQ